MECRNGNELKSDEATVPGDEDENHVIVGLTLIRDDDDDDVQSRDSSLASSNSKIKINPDICRICHCEETTDERLISPCLCLGTMQYLHQSCLQRWIKSSGVKSCELCKFEFIMHSEIKPFKQWQKLDMNIVERRKVMCSVAFNVIAITCILWALLVLIDKTREEVRNGRFQWPFWTKVIIVAIGFTGGLVFMYVQCKTYIKLCIRWRQFNQRIVIHSYGEQVENSSSTTGRKNSSPSRRADKPIITVLGASDLVPLNPNEASIRASNDEANNLTSNRVEQRSNEDHRTFFQRLIRFHRSDFSA